MEEEDSKLKRRLRDIDNVLIVLSGKGGVGKSSVSIQLSLSLLLNHSKNFRVGILDLDLTGPSLPRMLGLLDRSVLQSTDGWLPVEKRFEFDLSSIDQDHQSLRNRASTTEGDGPGEDLGDSEDQKKNEKTFRGSLKCMSIGFLLKDPKRDSVLWRGPKKNSMIKQFLSDVRWGELDWLIIDTPPGTSDEHITLLEQLSPLLMNNRDRDQRLPSLSSILVTTPQAVSLSDVSKEYDFTRKVNLRVSGLIENMSGYVCPCCRDVINVFGSGGGESFCSKINEDEKQRRLKDGTSEGEEDEKSSDRLEFLGKVPIDVELMKLFENPTDHNTDDDDDDDDGSDEKNDEDGNKRELEKEEVKEEVEVEEDFLKKYLNTGSSLKFYEICKKIVESNT